MLDSGASVKALVLMRVAAGAEEWPVELLVSQPGREPVSQGTHARLHHYTGTRRQQTFFPDKPAVIFRGGAESWLSPSSRASLPHLDDGQRGNLIVTYELLIFCKATSLLYRRCLQVLASRS